MHGGPIGDPPRTWIVDSPESEAKLPSLAEASGAIAGARGLEELLAVVTQAAQSIIGTHQAITSRLVDGWSDARSYLILSDKYADFRSFDQPPKGVGVLEYVTRENRPLRLTGEELAQHPDWRGLRDAPGHPPLPDYLAAPLVSHDGCNIGLIQLSDKIDGTPFSEDDEAVLVQLALMASAAIGHVELHEELETRVSHARLAAEVGMAFTSEADLAEKLRRCVQAVVDHLNAAFARVWTIDEPEDVLVLRASAGMYTHLDGEHARIGVGQYKIGRIAETRAPHLTNEVIGDPRVHDQAWAFSQGMVAFAGYPLLVGGRCVGVLALFARQPLPSSTLTALESVADSIAVGVDQVRTAQSLALLLATERAAREALDREHRLTESLDRVGRAVMARLDLHEIVQEVTDAATRLTKAAFGAFFYNVVDERGEAYQLYTLSGVAPEAFEGFPHPRNTAVFAPTFAGTGVVRLDDVTQSPAYGKNPPYEGMPEGHLAVRSYLAVPVVSGRGNVLGGLFFGHPEAGVFGPDEERLAVGIVGYAAIALDNADLYEQAQREIRRREAMLEERERVSRALQRPLSPPALPDIPGLDVAAIYRPYGEALEVGGDFYDVFDVPGGRWAFVVGDVSGKGPEAAAVTGLARPTLWAAGRAWGDPSAMLRLLNGAMLRAATERFCTAAVAVVDPAGPTVRVELALGGHPRPLIVRAGGDDVLPVEATGVLVGALAEPSFPSTTIELAEGDAVVLYTDGLTEGGSNQVFDDADLLAFLADLAGASAESMARALLVEAQRRREELRDDLAILIIRATGRS